MKKIIVSIIVIGLLFSAATVCMAGKLSVDIGETLDNDESLIQPHSNKPSAETSNSQVDDLNEGREDNSLFSLEYRGSLAGNLDMLIFISPQYVDDVQIQQAITGYREAVEDDIGWNTIVIDMTPEINDFKMIDDIIEAYYESDNIKACIMVGEDLDTALGTDGHYKEKPSTVPWYTTGGESSYEMSELGIVAKPYQMDICISLIYPTHELDYVTKSSQIISVFNKFSEQRHIYYTGDILVFESSDVNTYSKEIFQGLGEYGDLYYKEDPTDGEISESLTGLYSMYYVHGHSCPSWTDVNAGKEGMFSADNLDQLDTSFFGANGCYVGGWWSDQPDNNILDPSINELWYGSKIFTSPYIRVMVLGFPAQSGFSYPVSFIENAVPDLTTGKTLAESMIGHIYHGDDQTVYGDPTFHYSFDQNPPNKPARPSGKSSGIIPFVKYTYSTSTTDPDGDQVYYLWDWDDGTCSDWFGPYDSGETAEASHRWTKYGSYEIRVKAKDRYGAESEWSDPLAITMPVNQPSSQQTTPTSTTSSTSQTLGSLVKTMSR